MPDWLIWLAAFWLLFGCGAGCRRAWSHRRLRSGASAADANALPSGSSDPATAHAVPPGSSSEEMSADNAAPVPAEPQTALESLQRRFVDGALTLEQYEAELDRLDRKELG